MIHEFYYMCVQYITRKFLPGCPRTVRADYGTENVTMAAMQAYLRDDENSFKYGKSMLNQVCLYVY